MVAKCAEKFTRKRMSTESVQLYTKNYFSQRKATLATNNIEIERTVSKGCARGSCVGPNMWNIFYNSLLKLTFSRNTIIIAFADDLILLTRGMSVSETENTANIELRKISKWAQENKVRFNDRKSKEMLMSRRKRKERQDLEVYLNNKHLKQVKTMKYLGIIIDNKLTFTEHIKHMTEKRTKLIFSLSKSAKLYWGLGHTALKIIYTGGILPLILYGASVWSSVLNKECYRNRIIIQRLIQIKIAKAYRTVSNEALCVITGLIPINIKINETVAYYEYVKGNGNLFDREMELKYWNHPAKVVKIVAAQEEIKHTIQVYTDGSKA
jgi:hypothetical protein